MLDEIAGKPVKLRMAIGEGGPFSSSSISFLARILDFDPVTAVWKIRTEGGKSPQEAYFPTHMLETWLVISEEEFSTEMERIKKQEAAQDAKRKAHAASCKDCGEEEHLTEDEKWYGDPGKILEFLNQGEKEEAEG